MTVGNIEPLPSEADDFVRPPGPFLYKYGSCRRLEWLRPVLLEHGLYFPAPSQLNDPQDARPRLTASSRERALTFIKRTYYRAHPEQSLAERAWHSARMNELFGSLSADELAQEATPSFHSEMEKHRIYSVGVRPDNEHLWRYYAGNHSGYCLEFGMSGPFEWARMVKYGDDIEIDFSQPESVDVVFLFCKTTRYRLEEEARVVLFPRGQPHEVPFDPPTLRRIILERKISQKHRERIQRWARQREPQLTVTTVGAVALI